MNNQFKRQNLQLFPFHLVTSSPWPLAISLALMSLALTLGLTMHNYINNIYLLLLSILVVLASMSLWLRDVIIEATFLGDHTQAVRKGINIGFILFVISEALIFSAIFWSYFHSAIGPTIEIGSSWPPVGIESIKPTELPLLNTIILLASGATITWAHHGILNGNKSESIIAVAITTFLIFAFVWCQDKEYTFANFTIADGVYGSIFYAGTGLHFGHMVMLFIMLSIVLWRLFLNHLTNTHHVVFEITVLYLHVLDVIWLLLYLVFYWWGA